MPIKKENRQFYGIQWQKVIRPAILERDGHCCKFCGVPDRAIGFRDCSGEFHQDFGELKGGTFKIILTVAHLDQDPANNSDDNLAALCQRCHLNHDREFNLVKIALTRRQKAEEARARLAIKDLFL